MKVEEKMFMTKRQVYETVGISRSFFDALISRKEGPKVTYIGKKPLIAVQDFNNWLNNLRKV